MMFALIVLTDGRADCLQRTLRSADKHIGLDTFDEHVLVNDSADPSYRAVLDDILDEYLPEFTILPCLPTKRGFGGAIRAAWNAVTPSADFVFHLEDDFEFTRHVDIDAITEVITAHPYLQQIALRRQPWNDHEKAAGGIVEMWPDQYTDMEWHGHHWLEHDLFFTTNPSLYRAELMDIGWPDMKGSEMEFTRRVQCRSMDYRFAFWGQRSDQPWVHHIGEHRTGIGY